MKNPFVSWRNHLCKVKSWMLSPQEKKWMLEQETQEECRSSVKRSLYKQSYLLPSAFDNWLAQSFVCLPPRPRPRLSRAEKRFWLLLLFCCDDATYLCWPEEAAPLPNWSWGARAGTFSGMWGPGMLLWWYTWLSSCWTCPPRPMKWGPFSIGGRGALAIIFWGCWCWWKRGPAPGDCCGRGWCCCDLTTGSPPAYPNVGGLWRRPLWLTPRPLET